MIPANDIFGRLGEILRPGTETLCRWRWEFVNGLEQWRADCKPALTDCMRPSEGSKCPECGNAITTDPRTEK